MAEVLDRGKFWELVIDTTSKPVETINEPTKGYKAVIGENLETGKHVVMNVMYDKSMTTLDDVYKRVEQLRSCGRCQTLDKEKMKIDKIRIGHITEEGNAANIPKPGVSVYSADTTPVGSDPVVVPARKSGVKDMFANTFFDAFLTKPGKYFFSVLTNDEALLDSVMPKNDIEMGEFMDEMVEFMSGNMEFVRSPDQAREYLSVIRAGRESDGSSSKSNVKKRGRKDTPLMQIY